MNKIKTWFNLIFSLTEISSLWIDFDSHGKPNYKILEFRRKKDEIIAKNELKTFTNLEEMLSKKDSENGIVITLTGKGVLYKLTLSEKVGVDLVKTAFPQMKIADFHFQIDKLSVGYLVSIVRKSQIEELMDDYGIKNHLVSLNIGVASFASLFKSDVQLSTYQLKFKEEKLTEVTESLENVEQDIVFGKETLDYNTAILQLAAFCALLKIRPLLSSGALQFEKNANKNVELNLVKKGGISVIVLTLIMVLGNFICFSNLNKSYNEVSLKKMLVEKEMRDLVLKQNQIRERKELFDKLNFKEKTHHTELVDQIASRATKDIQFSTLEIYPEKNSKQSGKTIEFDRNTLIITGRAKHSNGFRMFTQSLNKLPLLKSVNMTQFSRNQKLGGYDFKLFVSLND